MFYTYVLQSLKDKKLYIGFCEDLKKRLKQHEFGNVPATKPRRPLKLVFFEGFVSKEDALAREKYFKSGWGRQHLKNTLKYTLSRNIGSKLLGN